MPPASPRGDACWTTVRLANSVASRHGFKLEQELNIDAKSDEGTKRGPLGHTDESDDDRVCESNKSSLPSERERLEARRDEIQALCEKDGLDLSEEVLAAAWLRRGETESTKLVVGACGAESASRTRSLGSLSRDRFDAVLKT